MIFEIYYKIVYIIFVEGGGISYLDVLFFFWFFVYSCDW